MKRTLWVAWREFAATALTKSFVFGFMVMPMMIFFAVSGAVLLFNPKGPAIEGAVAVIDHSAGQRVAEGLRQRFSAEVQAEEADQRAKALSQSIAKASEENAMVAAAAKQLDNPMAQAAMRQAMAEASLRLEVLPASADEVAERNRILSDQERAGDTAAAGGQRLALVVIPEQSVAPRADGSYTPYQVMVRPKLDIQVQENIRSKVRDSLVDARLEQGGFTADRARIKSMIMSASAADVQEVSRTGARKSVGEAAMLMPMAFMLLMWVAVFSAGQYLLTTTIEEKSSRVMEVLLSAVSSRQLMIGKIVGQMCVGLVILLAYASLGVGSLKVFNILHLLDVTNLAYLIVFFLIAFFVVACMMAAIGSAVSDLREAQALMTPVMLVLVIPMMLWMPISRDPNGTFATALSFTPIVNPFVMVLRIPAAAGSIPVPVWQIALSIAIGLATVVFMAWAAAKIFRVGVLMYGKPPNFATLVRWVRMA